MNILVTFEDGTTEERDAGSPCYPVWATPSDLLVTFWKHGRLIGPGPIDYIHRMRGREVWVWREAGMRAEGAPLVGRWVFGNVETQDEQIDRLTRELADAKVKCAEWRETSAEWQRKYDRVWMARDDARRIAVLDRKPLTADEYAELRALVDQAKREGWL